MRSPTTTRFSPSRWGCRRGHFSGRIRRDHHCSPGHRPGSCPRPSRDRFDPRGGEFQLSGSWVHPVPGHRPRRSRDDAERDVCAHRGSCLHARSRRIPVPVDRPTGPDSPTEMNGSDMDVLTSAIGRSVPRVDGRPKVTGGAQFAADVEVRGLLHARPVLALPAHARIVSIDASAALASPGVVAVLTAADLPIATKGTDRLHEPLAREEILWAGPARRARRRRDSRGRGRRRPARPGRHETPGAGRRSRRRRRPGRGPGPGRPRGRSRSRRPRSRSTPPSGAGPSNSPRMKPMSDNVVKRTGYRRGDVEAALRGERRRR